MKQTYALFFMMFIAAGLYAQNCVLSGQISNHKDSIMVIDLLYADGHYHNQSFRVKINATGKFRQSISLPYPIFALLKYNGSEKRLLLSPARNLQLLFDAKKIESSIKISGTAAPENTILSQLKIGAIPFYMEGKWEDNRYAKMPLDSLQKNVIQVTSAEAIAAEKKIAEASIPGYLRNILFNEFRYVNQTFLFDLGSNYMRWAKNKDQEEFLEQVIVLEPMPDSVMLESSLFANMIVDQHIRYALQNAGKNIKADSLGVKHGIEQLLQMPFTEIMKQAELYGERYIISWLYAKHNLAENIRDKVLFNKIMEACDNKLFSIAKVLEDTLQYYYPGSQYLFMARQELEELQHILKQQVTNTGIKFHSSKNVTSLKELAAIHKGKIIYLDIWGTWCGPCREEMPYTPELKKRYAGKNIVFVYIDMDEDNKESAWKEMVYMYKLEGEHYRLNNKDIQDYWKEIAIEGGKTNLYPTYVLFDITGKMIKPNAARPSDGEVLYKQLDEVLLIEKK